MRITRTICDNCQDEQSPRSFEVKIKVGDLQVTREWEGDLCNPCRGLVIESIQKATQAFGLKG